MDELYQEDDKSKAITDEALEQNKSAGMQDEDEYDAMDELYQEYDQSEAITDEVLERIKSAGMQDEYEAIKHHLWSSVTLINNLQLAITRKDNRLKELVNEDNTKEKILEIIQNDILLEKEETYLEKEKTYLENCRKGGSKTRFPEFVAAAIKIIEERGEGYFTRKDTAIIADRAAENLDDKSIPGDAGKIVRNLIKKYKARNSATPRNK